MCVYSMNLFVNLVWGLLFVCLFFQQPCVCSWHACWPYWLWLCSHQQRQAAASSALSATPPAVLAVQILLMGLVQVLLVGVVQVLLVQVLLVQSLLVGVLHVQVVVKVLMMGLIKVLLVKMAQVLLPNLNTVVFEQLISRNNNYLAQLVIRLTYHKVHVVQIHLTHLRVYLT